MKKLILTVMMMFLVGTSASAVAAQDEEFSPTNFDGLVSGYGRLYANGDYSTTAAPAAASPSNTSDGEATPEEANDHTVQIQTVSFDTEEHAAAFLNGYREESDRMKAQAPEGEIEVVDLDGLDQDGFALKIMPGAEGDSTAVLAFQDGSVIWVVEVRSANIDDALALANDYAKFVLDQDVDEDEVTFNADGTSTGGVFDRMPTEDDEILGGLKVIEDYSFLD